MVAGVVLGRSHHELRKLGNRPQTFGNCGVSVTFSFLLNRRYIVWRFPMFFTAARPGFSTLKKLDGCLSPISDVAEALVDSGRNIR